MSWKLWLDDQVNDLNCPKRHAPEGFKGAASSAEAQALVEKFGPPSFMDLDHDLGGEDTAMVFLRWLDNTLNECVNDMDNIDVDCLPIVAPPQWNIHSANGEGKKNIESFLSTWKNHARW